MATRSTIAIEHRDGTVSQIYCHWNGYPSNNGRILLESYSDRERLEQLMDLGDLSVLGADLGHKQNFDAPMKGWCLAYGRDRNEANCQARPFDDIEHFWRDGQTEEYNYVFRNGRWFTWDRDYDTGAVYVELFTKETIADEVD